MEMHNGTLCLSGVRACSVYQKHVHYIDSQGNKINIPMSVLIRLYELAKFESDRNGRNWEEYTNKIIDDEIRDNIDSLKKKR